MPVVGSVMLEYCFELVDSCATWRLGFAILSNRRTYITLNYLIIWWLYVL